jgi:hypothetical protein
MYEKNPDVVNALAWDPQDQQPMIEFLQEMGISYTIVNNVLNVVSGFMHINVPANYFVVITRELVCLVKSDIDMDELYTEIQ